MIGREEFQGRQKRFAAALGADDLAGALVVSRGGSTFDRYASVLYLTGHYQSYSYLPDAPGLFSGRAHAAFVLNALGQNALCVSVPEYDAASLACDDIRCSGDFVGSIVGAARDLGLTRGRVGLVGFDVIPARYWRGLAAGLPDVEFVEADELIGGLMRIKSPAEQALIRGAVSVHRRGVSALLEAVRPGATESDLVAALAASVMAEGAGLYFTSISSGPATWRWASSPLPGFSLRTLDAGDLVRCDTGIVHAGYLSDFGRTVAVGEPTPRQQRLLDVLHGGLEATIAAVRPGASVRSVVAAGEAALHDAGVVASDDGGGGIVSSFPVHWGHGLGLGWERPWMTETEDLTIEPGMYLAIERALTLPGVGSAAAEQTLLVGDREAEVLTASPNGFWS